MWKRSKFNRVCVFVQSLECGEHVVNCFLNVSILADCEPGEAELCHLNNPVKCCGAAAATKRVARHLVVIIHKMGLTRLNHNHIYQLNTNPEIRPVQWRNFNNIYPKYIVYFIPGLILRYYYKFYLCCSTSVKGNGSRKFSKVDQSSPVGQMGGKIWWSGWVSTSYNKQSPANSSRRRVSSEGARY